MILVIGLGKTGLSVVTHYAPQGQPLLAIDSRESPPNQKAIIELQEKYDHVVMRLGSLDISQDELERVELAVVSPGIDPRLELFEKLRVNHVPVISEIECFARLVQKPVIAITGSNGKSTVTDLIGRLLADSGYRVAVGGNFGTPAIALLAPNIDYYVLELSSFQLEATESLRPDIALLLNISPDHLDRYDSYEEYKAAKLKLFHLGKQLVINVDEDAGYKWSVDEQTIISRNNINDLPFVGFSHAATFKRSGEKTFLAWNNESVVDLADVSVFGAHNHFNLLCALAVAKLLHLEDADIRRVLSTYSGMPHRCMVVKKKNNILWVDDSKATNIGATIAAIDGFSTPYKGKTILIAGGDGKGADFSPLKQTIEENVKYLILIGKDKERLCKAIGNVPSVFADDMAQAVLFASKQAVGGDLVLLSPACASIDMYANFEQRGIHFADCVGALS